MPRMKIRTKSGRLRAGERRRRISAANLKPGEIVLLDSTRKRKRGVRSRDGISLDFVVATGWSADIDVRKFLHELRVNLADHYSVQLSNGQKPDGTGPLPKLAHKGEAGRTYGVKTGEMARHWILGAISGGAMRARCRLKPWGRGTRSVMINNALSDGVDFQSVAGSASAVITATIANWLPRMLPARGEGVMTPVSVPHGEMNLSDT